MFQTDVRFLVPMFQRPYVWTEERQWKPLMEDVTLLADRFLLESDTGVVNGIEPEQRTPRHFLGAVVVDQEGNVVGRPDRRLVVDGQQRLTTLQLLLNTVRRRAEALGEARSAAQLRRLVENGEEVLDPDFPEERWKVWPTNADRAAFVAAMTGHEAVPGGRFAEALQFFERAVDDWLHRDPNQRAEDRIRALALVLQSHLEVVAVELERDDNAQVIFETLNDRGEPLLAADLVKNHVFQNLQNPSDADRLYNRFWREFDTDRWRTQVRQGRLRRPRIDVFLQHWLALQLLNDVLATELFNTFKSLTSDHGRPVEDLLEHLSRSSVSFESLDVAMRERPESIEGRFVLRWRTLELTALTPLLLLLFGEQVDESDRQRGLISLESWMVRRALCRSTSKDINRFALDLIAKLAKGDGPPGAVLEQELSDAIVDTRRWPSDTEVRAALISQPIYGRVTQPRLAMVLAAIESDLRSERHVEQPAPSPGGLEIEHIMPREWRTYWRQAGMTEADGQRRDIAVQSLGNLTLVTSKVNKMLSNHPWTEQMAVTADAPVPRGGALRGKRNVLGHHSVLILNRDVLERAVDEWTEENIALRGEELTERILRIWPRPPIDDDREDIAPTWDPPTAEPASQPHRPGSRSSSRRELRNLPDGTTVHFRRRVGTITQGHLVVDGIAYETPSAAAVAVTHGSQANGWMVWKTADGLTLAELHDNPRSA
jgi:hypothetical protein